MMWNADSVAKGLSSKQHSLPFALVAPVVVAPSTKLSALEKGKGRATVEITLAQSIGAVKGDAWGKALPVHMSKKERKSVRIRSPFLEVLKTSFSISPPLLCALIANGTNCWTKVVQYASTNDDARIETRSTSYAVEKCVGSETILQRWSEG